MEAGNHARLLHIRAMSAAQPSGRDKPPMLHVPWYLRVDRSDLAVELSAFVDGDADVGQHTIVQLLEFANINVNAPLSGQATCQLDASQDEAAEPFRKGTHNAARAGPDDDEGQRRDGIVFLRHSKLLRGVDSAA